MKTAGLRRLGRALATLPVIALFFFPLFPMFPAAVPRDADVPAEGWWNYYSLNLGFATPSTVPADAIGIGHTTLQADKIAAIGITLRAAPGSTVQTLALHLKEADDVGANVGADTAVVSACPVTGFWDPVLNGDWSLAPTYDCQLGKATGKRSADGTWSFDLLAFGTQWLDAAAPLEQRGVMLFIEQGAQPVQISLRSIKTGEFRLEFAASAPAETEPVPPVVIGGLEVPEAPVTAPVVPTAPVQDTAPEVVIAQPAQNRTEKLTDPDVLGNLPWGAWLLVPIAIGLAAMVSYALGEGGRRGGKLGRREGAVTRALSRGSRDG